MALVFPASETGKMGAKKRQLFHLRLCRSNVYTRPFERTVDAFRTVYTRLYYSPPFCYRFMSLH